MLSRFIYLILPGCMLLACSSKPQAAKDTGRQTKAAVSVPVFNADSAYLYTQQQVLFGPRVPNTPAHVACGDYFVAQLNHYGAQVTEQKVDLQNYAGLTLKCRNIVASFQPENTNRVLLCAHWDTRPYADHDKNPDNWRKPIDGANDGASGCGVLLEIARQIQLQQPRVGIDLVFFDAEDWGVPAFERSVFTKSGYCLGSEYWSKHPHVPNYTAKYGILFDMVGAPEAVFYKESYSMRYASQVVKTIWETAQALGYGNYFISQSGGTIEDDHVQIIRNLQIRCVDIIHCEPNSATGFGAYWHTLDDTMDNVSKETLQAVGQTVLHVIYNE